MYSLRRMWCLLFLVNIFTKNAVIPVGNSTECMISYWCSVQKYSQLGRDKQRMELEQSFISNFFGMLNENLQENKTLNTLKLEMNENSKLQYAKRSHLSTLGRSLRASAWAGTSWPPAPPLLGTLERKHKPAFPADASFPCRGHTKVTKRKWKIKSWFCQHRRVPTAPQKVATVFLWTLKHLISVNFPKYTSTI